MKISMRVLSPRLKNGFFGMRGCFSCHLVGCCSKNQQYHPIPIMCPNFITLVQLYVPNTRLLLGIKRTISRISVKTHENIGNFIFTLDGCLERVLYLRRISGYEKKGYLFRNPTYEVLTLSFSAIFVKLLLIGNSSLSFNQKRKQRQNFENNYFSSSSTFLLKNCFYWHKLCSISTWTFFRTGSSC